MPGKASPADIENAILAYQSGESCQNASSRYHTSQERLRAELKARGCWRDIAATRKIAGRKAWDTRAAALPTLPVDTIATLYLAGESELALSERFGVARNTIRKRLIAAGVTPRTGSEAQRLKLSKMTPEQRMAQSSAAHAAVRGTSKTWESKCKGALTRQERQLGVSASELALQCWLQQRGIESIPQMAIGAYNADLGIGSVVVEIFGGGWHAHGRHRQRTPERYSYLFDQGFNVLVIWVHAITHPLRIAAADYVAAFVEQSRSNPTMRGEYRVIWGDGKDVTPDCLDLDNIAHVPPLG